MGAKLLPKRLLTFEPAPKVHALVQRRVDVAGPKETDVAVLKHVLLGLTLEFKIDVMRRNHLECRPTLQMPSRRRRLMQLD